MSYINLPVWDSYREILDEFLIEDVCKDDLLWKRYKGSIPTFGEDSDPTNNPPDIILKCLFQYNDYRTWPITQYTQTGPLDKQSEVAWLSKTQLKANNLLDEHDRLIFNRDQDIFIHRGLEYECSGDTDAAQANVNPILFMLILKRKNG